MGAPRESPVSRAAVEWVYRIQTRPGPGLLESVYEAFPAPQLTAPGYEAHRIEEGITPPSST